MSTTLWIDGATLRISNLNCLCFGKVFNTHKNILKYLKHTFPIGKWSQFALTCGHFSPYCFSPCPTLAVCWPQPIHTPATHFLILLCVVAQSTISIFLELFFFVFSNFVFHLYTSLGAFCLCLLLPITRLNPICCRRCVWCVLLRCVVAFVVATVVLSALC